MLIIGCLFPGRTAVEPVGMMDCVGRVAVSVGAMPCDSHVHCVLDSAGKYGVAVLTW